MRNRGESSTRPFLLCRKSVSWCMKIFVRVKPNAKKSDVRQLEPNRYLVSVTAPPIDNKANEKVIEVLAEYFNKPKRNVSIVRGSKGREKIVEIL